MYVLNGAWGLPVKQRHCRGRPERRPTEESPLCWFTFFPCRAAGKSPCFFWPWDFSSPSVSLASQRLFLSVSFRRLAAVRCTFKGVVSIISAFVPAFANFCKILANTPSLLHRTKRLYNVFWTYSRGASFHLSPLRRTWTIPPMTLRSSTRSLPRDLGKYGFSSSKFPSSIDRIAMAETFYPVSSLTSIPFLYES
jgi:hypothetical protein